MGDRSGAHRSRSRSHPRTGVSQDPRDEGAGDYHPPRTPDTSVTPGPPTHPDATPPTRFAPPTPCAVTPHRDLSATGDGGMGIPLSPRTPLAAGQIASPAPSALPIIAPPGLSMPKLWPGYHPPSDRPASRGELSPVSASLRDPPGDAATHRTPAARAVITRAAGAPPGVVSMVASAPLAPPATAVTIPSRRPTVTDSDSTPQRCRPAARESARPRRSPSAPPRMDTELSPMSAHNSDMVIVAELHKRGVLSRSLLEHIAMFLNDRGDALDRASAAGTAPTIAADRGEGDRGDGVVHPPPLTPLRRPRTSDGADAAQPKRPCTQPLPSRDPRIRRRVETAPAPYAGSTVPPPAPASVPAPTGTDRNTNVAEVYRAPTTFADALRTAGPSPTVQAGPSAVPQEGAKAPPKPKFPPLIVEDFPNWTAHFRALHEKLGHAPNARPLGRGMRFTPGSVDEYRTIQSYLCELEKTERLSWFSYALPSELSRKVAIRGLPATTSPAEIIEALGELGYQAEYVRPIRARMGRPGCVFFAVIANTPDVVPGIYGITELLYLPGIKIEAWRAKRGPAQCHRCQAFRHSSHGCHRRLACVRCGGEHPARDCQRPLEEPATCANCGGPHPANHSQCPQYRHEARNKRAGTVALSQPKTTRRPTGQSTAPVAVNMVPADTQATTLMAPANPPSERGARKKKRGKGKRGLRQAPPAAEYEPAPAPPAARTRSTEPSRTRRPEGRSRTTEAAPTSAAEARPTNAPEATPIAQPLPATRRLDSSIDRALDTLQEVLLALREGRDPVQTVVELMMRLVSNG